MIGFINFLKKNDFTYIIENRMQGQILLTDEYEKIGITETKILLWRMADEVYKEKKHIGSELNEVWNHNKIKFCDLLHNEVLHHPEISALHNFTFHSQRIAFNEMREDWPNLTNALTEHGILREYAIEKAVKQMENKIALSLIETKYHHSDKLIMDHTIKGIMDRLKAEKQLAKEKQKEIKENTNKDNGVNDNDETKQ